MKPFSVLRSLLFIRKSLWVLACSLVIQANAAAEAPKTKNKEPRTSSAEPFRPEAGKFPPLEKSAAYRGELVFVDHANRRGSLRVPGEERFFRNPPHPFALLPYGMVHHHGAPADLRDIPLGTMLHGRFYLPPDPSISVVPVIQKSRDSQPAENHAILLEDEPSHCLRTGKVWRLSEVEIQGTRGRILARRGPKDGGDGEEAEEMLTLDTATVFWRGREKLGLQDLITEGIWPTEGKKPLDGQAVYLGVTWKPSGGWASSAFNQFHVSDIWLDDAAMQRASAHQAEKHKDFIRSRWMPAWVDAVEYGEFGKATITATLFGGMDAALYQDFKKGGQGQIGAAELTLKHSSGGYGHAHMAIKGPIVEISKAEGEIPLGSSGIQIRMKVDLALEGFRPGRIVRIRPLEWPADEVPREEFLPDGHASPEERFPTPAIFPDYKR
jgi:hypothetical protein